MMEEFNPFAGPAILRSAPTTEAQREIWTAAHLSTEASLCYNESITVSLTGPVNLEALSASFAAVVDRHEALRSTVSDDGLTFLVGETPTSFTDVHDVVGLPEADQEAFFAGIVEREVETPFDLGTGPLFRLQFVRMGSEHVRAILTAHHIVLDGWSTAVILREWVAFYNARIGQTEAMIDEPLSYCNYAIDEIDYRSTDAYRSDVDFWLAQYRSPTMPNLALPSDRPRPRLRTFEARRCDLKLSPELVQALRKTGAKQGTSLFTALLAGFKALLFRLSNQDDIVVGIPSAGQSAGVWQTLVGHCVNVLPLRSALDGDLPFSGLVGALRTAVLDAHEHQRMTFGSLVAQLPIPRDPSRPQLVSVLFNVDPGMPSEALAFEGLVAELETNERHFEAFDLFLNAVETSDGMVLECQYNLGLFDEATIRRWLAAYERLLSAVTTAPDLPIAELPLVSDIDREQVERWNAAAEVDHRIDVGIAELIEKQMAAAPDAIACEFEGHRLTNAELNARATELAGALMASGIGRGDLVGLAVERSNALLVGLLGILKSGAGYVPLDPGFPVERLEYMVEDSAIAALVTERATQDELQLPVSKIFHLDDGAPGAPGGERADLLAPEIRPDDVAYVIYTSGSTGKPKGVAISHRSVINLFHSMQRAPGMSSDDVVLAVTTFSFDISVVELLLPLAVGAKVVIASRETASDGGQLLDLLRNSDASYIQATPATYRLLFSAGFDGDPDLKVVCGGEALPLELGQRLAACVGSLWNAYGPTETTIWSSFFEVRADTDRVLIGYPADNTRLYVLDESLEQTPIGVPGELYIAGHGLSLGYLNKPDLTADRFVPEPFGNGDTLMYKTGDLARYMSDGQLECLGRNDFQVKVRGYRIELGEIEHVLDRHPSVLQSVVMAREDTPGDTRLVAYVRLDRADDAEGDGDANDTELRSHLRLALPDYMVPSAFVSLPDMPLTPNGKVDRKALPAPLPSTMSSQRPFVEPRTEMESLIAELFQEALSVPRVSADDDFFALGGHSLLASQVLARLRQDHGISVSFRIIFEAPTVEGLAIQVARIVEEQGPEQPALRSIEHRIETGDAPLSVAQERLRLLEEMDPSQELVHNLPAAWRLDGPVDLELLQRAVDEIARRHGTLRTHLASSGNTVVQRIEPSVELPIEAIDLRGVAEVDREAELIRVVNERTRERFDLHQLPLFRSYLIRVDEERYVFHSVRHNLIWDGWSFDVFLRELTELYSAFQRGEASSLPELPISYADYVGYQHEFLQGDEVARQIEFWGDRLSGEPPEATLPSDRPRQRVSQHRGENLILSLGQAQAEALTSLGRGDGATLYMVLLAAFKAMLHRYSKERDLVVGTPVRARQLPEVEGLIGPFINAVAIRTTVDPELAFTELVTRVRDVTLDSFSNEDMPLEMLGARPPIVRTFFSFQDATERPAMLGDVSVEQLHVEPPAAANDLMLWIMQTPADLLVVANYDTELFDQGTIEAFLEGFQCLLEAVVSTPDAAVGALPISAGGDEEALRSGEPDGELLDEPCASWLDQAERRPDAAALRSGEQVISYGQLVANVAGIASSLQPSDGGVVGIHAVTLHDRTAAMFACLAMDRPFTLLAGDAPSEFVEQQRLERGCQLLLADGDSSFSDGPDVIRFGHQSSGAVLTPVQGLAQASAWVGSGGKPTSRAAVATTAEALSDALGLTAGQQIAWVLPAGSDAELLLSLAALGRGACVHALSPRDRLDRSELGDIDILVAAPSTLSRYSAAEFERVRTVVVVGEPAPDLTEQLMADGKSFLRLHVIDEVGLVTFVGNIAATGASTCIGRPLYPARAAVVDVETGPCSKGLEGELFVGTTAPVGVEPASLSWSQGRDRFVATGDRSRVRADGHFEIREFAPERIQMMGVRFDGLDVATCLEGHPALANAHVVSSPAPSGDLRLVAYVRAARGEAYTATELRRYVRDHLPEVMVPQLFVDTDEWPVGADGLLDVAKLLPTGGSDDALFVEARTESERLLAEIWRDELGIERVGAHDNFFALGGHSLLCFKVLTRIQDRTAVRLGPRVVLLGSLEQAAAELDSALKDGTSADSPVGSATMTDRRPDASAQPDSAPSRSGRLLRKLRNSDGRG